MATISFRNAVTRSVLASALLPLAIMSAIGWFGISRLQTEALKRENAAYAHTVRAEVDGYLGRLEVLVMPYRNNTYQELLGANLFKKLWQQRVDAIDPLESMALLDADGKAVLSVVATGMAVPSDLMLGLDYSASDELMRANRGDQPTWSDVHVSPVSGEPVVSLVLPLAAGAIVLELSLSDLGDVLQAGTGGTTSLVLDRHGVILHHPDPELVKLRPNLADHEFIQKALRGAPAELNDFELDGELFLASAEPMSGTGWVALSLDPQANVREAVQQTQRVAMLMLALGGALAFTLAWVLSRSLSRPVTALTEQVCNVGKGNYDLPHRDYRYDEINVLGEALEDMSDAVKEREERVTASAQQYRFLAESLRGVPYEYDYGSDRFTYVGPQALGLLGYPAEAWTDFAWWAERIHPDDRDATVRECVSASDAGRHHELTYRMIDAAGETVYVHDVVSVYEQPHGATHLVGVLIDVTEATRTNELRLAAELAGAASRAKSGFLAYMSHELRTPLNSIIGFSQIMLDGLTGDLTEEQRRQIGIIRRSGTHLMALVNDILDLEKIERGAVDVTVTEFDLGALVQRSLDDVAPLADSKSLEHSLELPRQPILIRSDEDKIRQVLLNLLSNAIKFTEAGGVRVSVAHGEGESVRVVIADSGVGISADLLDEIFDEFRSIGRVGDALQKSTGLGLAIARRLARLLGGDILVSSEVGSGSTFTVILPIEHKGEESTGRDTAGEAV